jgi:hypothetical protein
VFFCEDEMDLGPKRETCKSGFVEGKVTALWQTRFFYAPPSSDETSRLVKFANILSQIHLALDKFLVL